MTEKRAFIEIKDLCKWYPHRHSSASLLRRMREGKQWVKAVDGVRLSLEKGEILGIIGESGCGKSTLGRLLTQIEPPSSGEVFINGESAAELLRNHPLKFREEVQIVFQNPFDTFTPRDTLYKILMRSLKIHKIGANRAEREERMIRALEQAALKPAADILKRYPHELSGGQLQRLSILRSMFLNPSFIIADEPVSMLDVSVRADIINMLIELSRNNQAAVVFISHDIALTRYISHNVAVMYLGRVVEYGPADEIIRHAAHPYTQALLSNCASIDPEEELKSIHIEGEPPTPINPGPGCYFAARCFKACERCFKEYPATTELGAHHQVACWYAKPLSSLSLPVFPSSSPVPSLTEG